MLIRLVLAGAAMWEFVSRDLVKSPMTSILSKALALGEILDYSLESFIWFSLYDDLFHKFGFYLFHFGYSFMAEVVYLSS